MTTTKEALEALRKDLVFCDSAVKAKTIWNDAIDACIAALPVPQSVEFLDGALRRTEPPKVLDCQQSKDSALIYEAARLYAAGHVANAWQDISTAPKNGTTVFVYDYYMHNNQKYEDGRYMQTGPDGFGIVSARYDDAHGWHVAASVTSGKYIKLTNPIKWQPLPPPPSTKEI